MQDFHNRTEQTARSPQQSPPEATGSVDADLKQNFSAGLRRFFLHFFPRPPFIARDAILALDQDSRLCDGVELSVNVRSIKRLQRKATSIAIAQPNLDLTFPQGGRASLPIVGRGLNVIPCGQFKSALESTLASVLGDKSKPAHLIDFQICAPSGARDDARLMILRKDYDGPIFICDIDDTLRATNRLKMLLGICQTPLDGVKDLLRQVVEMNIPIVYLSAAPDRFRIYNEAFLKDLPAGVLINRPEAGFREFLSSNGRQANQQAEFKCDILGKIMQTFPQAQFFGLGDDKFGDALAYRNHNIRAFIRDVRPGDDNLPANFQGTQIRDYSKQVVKELVGSLQTAFESSQSFGFQKRRLNALVQLNAELDLLTGTRSTANNLVRVLLTPDEARSSLIKGIQTARRNLFFEVFQFKPNDQVTREICAELKAAKARGVNVRLVLDAFGSRHFPFRANPQIVELIDAGVDVQIFNPLKTVWKLGWQRDHRKLMIVDNSAAFLGGMNIGDRYLGGAAVNSRYRDMHARIEGPCVIELIRHFANSYQVASGGIQIPEAELNSPQESELQNRISDQGVPVRIVAHVPDQDKHIRAVYLSMINRAQDHIFIENPYPFASDIVLALQAAAQRGVTVRCVIGNSKGLIDYAARAVLPLLLRAGVRVYVYPGPIHTKALSIDGKMCAFGSSNFDEVALNYNREILAVVDDPEFTRKLEQDLFVKEFKFSEPGGQQTHKFKHETDDPWYKKIWREALLVVWPERFK